MKSITRQSDYYDNTKLACYKECPRKYLIRHVLHWTTDSGYQFQEGGPILKAPALVFGGAWHAGMDAMWAFQGHTPKEKCDEATGAFLEHWVEEGYPLNLTLEDQEDISPRTPGIAREMFFNYATQREKMLEECEVVAIEQPIAVPFPNLSDTWYIGKLDKVFRYSGLHIGEHKTTSMYAIKGMFQPDWVDQWNSASQCKGYQFGGSMYYPDLQDVWVDGALVHKKVHDAFKLVPVSHNITLLEEWLADTGEWMERIHQDILGLQIIGDLSQGDFPRNEDSCFGKYSRCPFLAICQTTRDPTLLKEVPPGFRVEKWEPFDELGIDKLVSNEQPATS